jgi:hypothetical protein
VEVNAGADVAVQKSKYCFLKIFLKVVAKSSKNVLYGCSHKKEKYRKASAERQDLATDFVCDNTYFFHSWRAVLGINGCKESSRERNGYNPILNL